MKADSERASNSFTLVRYSHSPESDHFYREVFDYLPFIQVDQLL